jgi:hypothetical protein
LWAPRPGPAAVPPAPVPAPYLHLTKEEAFQKVDPRCVDSWRVTMSRTSRAHYVHHNAQVNRTWSPEPTPFDTLRHPLTRSSRPKAPHVLLVLAPRSSDRSALGLSGR